MDKKISGFRFCAFDGHQDVDIYKTENGNYYLQIDYTSSEEFSSLNDPALVWEAVEQVEERRKLMASYRKEN